ncbi:MAG: hypothetical protein R2853_05305 [Thermomicrobiales bacterium]
MTDSPHTALRLALAELAPRRTLLGAALAGTAGMLASTTAGDAKKKRKKRKKRCKNGAKRCGKGCCKAPSVCSAASCFCTGNEGNCTPVSQELIDIIADALGRPADQVGQNPDQPLAGCDDIPLQDKDAIDGLLKQEFGIIQIVPWCEGGINAGSEAILEQLTKKG